MVTQKETNNQLSLLTTYRRRLTYHLEQQAMLGVNTPFSITEEIREARERIKLIKIALQELNHPVEDYPTDGSTINPSRPNWDIILPKGHKKNPEPLTEEEIKTALERLPNWVYTTIRLSKQAIDAEDKFGVEIMRTYQFTSFKEAITFMGEAKTFIDEMNHHPRWENVWRSITVWLSTWDIGLQISQWDIDLAEKLDGLFQNYQKSKS
jgi:pterin-4a-carbinolamine dehydratase